MKDQEVVAAEEEEEEEDIVDLPEMTLKEGNAEAEERIVTPQVHRKDDRPHPQTLFLCHNEREKRVVGMFMLQVMNSIPLCKPSKLVRSHSTFL